MVNEMTQETAGPVDLGSKAWPIIQRGERCEITADFFADMEDILPPVYVGRHVTTVTGESVYAEFGHAEGSGVHIVAFWRTGVASNRRYFAQQTTDRTRG